MAAALVSMFGVVWWIVVPLTLAGLSVSSLPKYIELWPRGEARIPDQDLARRGDV
ncbi:MAG TPA: hypothetical protein VFB63_13495 [Bryobacteraceae bacterium]|nr:hypothetical protein [Bryobacteraceae bacterium]